MDEFEQIEAEIGRISGTEKRLRSAISLFGERQRIADRAFIVKWIVGLYVGSIGLGIIYLMTRGLLFGKDDFADISELIKIAVVPVLTLVVGYYFGTERR
jgi:hypothetical protein